MTAHPYLTNAGTLRGFIEFVRSHGVAPEPLLARAEISPDDIGNSEKYIPSLNVARALEYAARETGNDHFGLDFAAERDLVDCYGAVAALSRTCANFESSFKTFIARSHLIDQSAIWHLDNDGKTAFLTRISLLSAQTRTLQQTLLEIGGSYRTCKLAHQDWNPLLVTFTHDKPRNPRTYERFFHAPVAFGREQNGFSLSTEILARKQPRYNPARYRELDRYACLLESASRWELRDTIKTMISRHLDESDYTLPRLSAELGIGPRTLLRRLKQQDITYRDLVLETRMELAAGYLKNSSTPLLEIAQFLGYTELSTFSRAFHHWYGQPPSIWRTTQQL